MRFRIAAAVLALSLLLAGCGKGSSDKVKTVVIENGNVSRTAAADISGDWSGWWRMYGTSGEWAQMDGCWWDCCAEIKNGAYCSGMRICRRTTTFAKGGAEHRAAIYAARAAASSTASSKAAAGTFRSARTAAAR